MIFQCQCCKVSIEYLYKLFLFDDFIRNCTASQIINSICFSVIMNLSSWKINRLIRVNYRYIGFVYFVLSIFFSSLVLSCSRVNYFDYKFLLNCFSTTLHRSFSFHLNKKGKNYRKFTVSNFPFTLILIWIMQVSFLKIRHKEKLYFNWKRKKKVGNFKELYSKCRQFT